METKKCGRCKLDLDLNKFKCQTRNGKEMRRSWCVQCDKDYSTEYRNKNRDKVRRSCERWYEKAKSNGTLRNSWIKAISKRIGVAYEDLLALKKAHSGVCDICEDACQTGKSLAIDHDHSSGHVRGLLCQRCNVGLGQFNDDPARLKKAIDYLAKSPQLLSQVPSDEQPIRMA